MLHDLLPGSRDQLWVCAVDVNAGQCQIEMRLGNQLLDTAFSLHTLPERGRVVPEFRRPELREIVFRSYRIIYRVNNSDRRVEIVRFWHAARGFPHIPGNV